MAGQGGDDLIARLCAGDNDPVAADELANEQLKEIFDGYPIEKLSRLIHSDDDEAVKAGAWVVSELGKNAAPLMGEVTFLLEHRLPGARFFAIDAVLTSATGNDGATIAKAVTLIADSDARVRWKALQLLARATPDQLTAGLPYVQDSDIRELTTWLITDGSDPLHLPENLAMLEDSHDVRRRFAVSAAARLAGGSREAIERAAVSSDPEIRAFAGDELAALGERDAKNPRPRDP